MNQEICCPKCGKKETVLDPVVEWFAHSLEPNDLHNTAVLDEYQCEQCGISWWM